MAESNTKRILGRPELLALAIGQVIGAGVVTVLGAAITETGRSAPWAYLVAVIVGFIAIIPFVLLSSTLRISGGDYSIVSLMAGDKVGGIYGLIKITGMLPMALYGTSFAMYFNSIVPAADKRVVGVAILVVFYILNMLGVEIMAKAQKYMTTFLLIAMGAFIIFGLFNLSSNPFDASTEDFLPNGMNGFLTAFTLLIFSTSGHWLTINYSNEAKDSKRDIPWAIMVTSLIIGIVYTLIGIVAANVLPVAQVAGRPLTDVAAVIFPPILLAGFIVFGPGMCITTTANSSMVTYTRPVVKAAKDGFLPEFFSRENKRGASSVMLTICFIIGVIPIILNFSVSLITSNLVLISYGTKIFVNLCLLRMPDKFPEEWKASHMHISDSAFRVVVLISCIAQIFIAYWAAKNMTPMLLIVNIGFVVLASIYGMYRYNTGKANVKANVLSE